MRLRICHKACENGIGDASLEAPQRLLAGLALSDLLAVVGSAPSIRPGLAYRHHVQGVVEVSVAGQRKPVAHHLPAGGLHRRRASVGGEVRLGVGKRATLPSVPMILAARMGPTPKISVRVVLEASTSASMLPLRSAIFLSSVLMSRRTSPKPTSGGCATRSFAAVCRAGCVRPGRPRASRLPRQGRDPAGAHASGLALGYARPAGPRVSPKAS